MYNQHISHNYPIGMRQALEWHMPENVVVQMNDVLVHEILFLEKFIRGRATGTHTLITPNAAQAQPNRH